MCGKANLGGCVYRKRCERDGKYLEARAASVRLAELKTQEAQRMRQAIVERQVSRALYHLLSSQPYCSTALKWVSRL